MRDRAANEHLKLTELGMLPGDWEIAKLSDIALLVTGSTPPTRDAANYGEDFMFVSPADLGKRKFVLSTNKGLSRKGFGISRRLPTDAILFVCIGSTIGKCGIASRELATNQQINAVLPTLKSSCDYLYYSLCAAAGRIRAVAGEQAVPMVNKSGFGATLVALPPVGERHAIGETLSAVDSLLEGVDSLIAKKRDLKQAAMQQLLTGRVRLAGHGREWKQASLGDLFTFKNGLNKAKEFFGFGTPIVNYMDVYNGAKIRASRVEGRVSLSVDEIKNFEVRRGDVLFTRTSETPEEVGMAAVILDESSQTVFSGFVLRARPRNDELCDEFKAYCFRSSFVRGQIISKSTYTTRALTNGRQLSVVTLPVPPKSEQAAIAAVLSSMDDELAALELRRQKTLALKQAMMQQLLTGRIRLI